MKILKWALLIIIVLAITISLFAYLTLRGSLPTLSGEVKSTDIQSNATLARDALGTAIIDSQSELDAMYLLGYAHAQDRLFQMDLMRRQSAGELSELIGKRTLLLDKKHRIHQFRKRANTIFNKLPSEQQNIINAYTKGVNAGANSLSNKPFEYYLLGSDFIPWQPEDSLLVIYSMYLDLQGAQTEIDYSLTALRTLYGDTMYRFFTLPSNYQAAIDGSIVDVLTPQIPSSPYIKNELQKTNDQAKLNINSVTELADIGSNNWVVSSAHGNNGALLSSDMHLGLRVPSIWYRSQLNYTFQQQIIQITGVTLPGSPGVIAGSNGFIAWGFTNSNVDNVDWIALDKNTQTQNISETINTKEGEETFTFEISQYGPVREFNGQKYALKWVAHQDYAINSLLGDMAKMHDIDQALALSKKIRIPVQNMVVADANGDVAWQLTGAITARTPRQRYAITENDYSNLWESNEPEPANSTRPTNGKIATANARVVSAQDLSRYGNGGYALGARQKQIVDLLQQQNKFTEQDFYDLQLNNEARFLMPWHDLLLKTLRNNPEKYATDIQHVEQWKACACTDSIGYTLVRRFRSAVINSLLTPIEKTLDENNIKIRYVARDIEPAVWLLINNKISGWLPQGMTNYEMFLSNAYDTSLQKLKERHANGKDNWQALRWGNVNKLKIQHPFAKSFGPFKDYFNMPEVEGFGDSFIPAVQTANFGASQRLIVNPKNQENGILTVPGGQSGHVLSQFYKNGFKDYAENKNTPLLPGEKKHSLDFIVQ